jgi:hypothetical protein
VAKKPKEVLLTHLRIRGGFLLFGLTLISPV